jgi:hypothetical protein
MKLRLTLFVLLLMQLFLATECESIRWGSFLTRPIIGFLNDHDGSIMKAAVAAPGRGLYSNRDEGGQQTGGDKGAYGANGPSGGKKPSVRKTALGRYIQQQRMEQAKALAAAKKENEAKGKKGSVLTSNQPKPKSKDSKATTFCSGI